MAMVAQLHNSVNQIKNIWKIYKNNFKKINKCEGSVEV